MLHKKLRILIGPKTVTWLLTTNKNSEIVVSKKFTLKLFFNDRVLCYSTVSYRLYQSMLPEIEYYSSDKLEILCLEFYFRTEFSPYLTSRFQNECFLNCVLALTASYLQFSASCLFAWAIEWVKPWHGRWQIITFFGSPSHQRQGLWLWGSAGLPLGRS